MARPKDPAVRSMLIERAGQMLRTREPITLRSLVADTGYSTMAVYTHFGSMDGLWTALRQEGHTRMGVRFRAVPITDDPVLDLTAHATAYIHNALEHPDLYRVMFDATFGLEDDEAADEGLECMVQAAARGIEAGRFAAEFAPLDLAVQTWAVTHGLAALVATGPQSHETLSHGPILLEGLFERVGDEPNRCRASVTRAWRDSGLPHR
ncbi:TetR/AcrR family transcriptional regulator [Kineosporia sp. NBRC 101731]|uniref:TetR/AcrR family transcriptional regulator n=1 Tax=Kineosporia sp. NBRC 101731 TaxID=3032199 RepID=UPI002554A8B5|nr:TetR/AcrR family transcriptional regulator [Kineosporia sp. NBRC 101731]